MLRMNLAFSSYDELRCLHLTICEAKFHEDPNRWEIQGSPFVGETANKVYDLLISNAPTPEKAAEWEAFRNLEQNNMVFPVVRSRSAQSFRENDWSDETKRKYLVDLAAPFTLSESLTAKLLCGDGVK